MRARECDGRDFLCPCLLSCLSRRPHTESKVRTAKRTAAEKRMAHDFIKCFLISGWT